MKAFQAQFSGSMQRDGKPARSFDVAARRFTDGAFQACIRVPSSCGSTLHTVEVTPSQARMVRELMHDTNSALKSALAARSSGRDVVGWYDVVGHTYDLVGAVAPRVAAPVVNGAQYRYDLVGDLGSTLRSALGGVSNPSGAAQGVGLAALGGLASGGLEGAAQGALGAIGGAMGLDPQQAQDIAQRLAGKTAPITDPSELQARRDRALNEMAMVIAQGTHQPGSDNWRGAISYHQANLGITPQEAMALWRDQGVLATLPRVSPYITNPSLQEGPRVAQQGPARARADLAGAMARATSSEALMPVLRTPGALVGVATAQSTPDVSAQQAGAALGASELLARALASLALERGTSDASVSDAARVASAALRSVDAIAGARAGDPRARAVLRSAVNESSARLARALRASLALVGEG